ncbi:MAG: hypothetical protein N2381_10880 [Armatimonadetes bacterium]|nr:hypothetical protein [Armatimonadota bacterium]
MRHGTWSKGGREKGQFRTPLRFRFVANYELGVYEFVVRHGTKWSAVIGCKVRGARC